MSHLHLDVSDGARADALLGALVDVGASLEAIEAAVSTLGRGRVRLQLQTGPSGAALVLRAPEDAPTHEFWGDLRPRIAHLALEETVVERALQVLDTVFAARAAVHGVAAEDVDVDPFSGPDDLAAAVALAAALEDLGPTTVTAGPVGHGTGTLHSIEGDVPLPPPVVATILGDVPTAPRDVAMDLVDPVGGAFVAALEHAATGPGHETALVGRGRLPGGGSVRAVLVGADTRVGATPGR